MKARYQFSIFLIGVLAVTGTAYGQSNTSYGEDALDHNDYGVSNTAFGFSALFYNFAGSQNSATGTYALFNNVTGNNNTATGYEALYSTTSSINNNNNTATGYAALYSDVTGSENTATGYEALYGNSDGNYNTAAGYAALYENTTGNQNTASGVNAMHNNKGGSFNSASGGDALFSNTTGSSNIAEGYKAGYNLTTGSNNIDVGSEGTAAESDTIRIGSAQTATYIAGIFTNNSITSGGLGVVVNSSGELGVVGSSERFKTAITPMGSDTVKLGQLRPVSFRLKSDATGTRQYGLIAEEVAKVYPELVIRDRNGRIDGVRYDELAPMLLNEMELQKQQLAGQLNAQAAEIRDLKAAMLALQESQRGR
jgi:hypothetical protein